MASVLHQFFPILQIFFIITVSCLASKPSPQRYIVYMGSSSTSVNGGEDLLHLQLLSSLIPSDQSERNFALHSYSHAFKGFSALLTEDEASMLSGHKEVVSVFPDRLLQLHTTRSWDFLEAAEKIKLKSRIPYGKKSADVIIGIIDTGIWPESPSFNDRGMGKIPSRWNGVCMKGFAFNRSNCNRKLIGARFYTGGSKPNDTNPEDSPRDTVGHGTHTASTAGGSLVVGANYYGLAKGVARGGFPNARLASYKACTQEGCPSSSMLKAFDDAVKDGVDIISFSIGIRSDMQSDFLNDPVAIGAFHAEQKGVMVIGSAGNEGPLSQTVVNTAPWIFTVAASTVDRDFQSTILLGNKESYQGMAISFSSLTRKERYPLILGEKAAARSASASKARNCDFRSLDPEKVAGKIVVCESDDISVSRRIKMLVAEDAKAKGMILIVSQDQSIPLDTGVYPFAEVGETIGSRIRRYIKLTKKPTATILPTRELRKWKPAPVAASFSSRGPGILTENILKPDITAPGVSILAAYIPTIGTTYSAPGNKPSLFSIRSGTSMACPHVSGAAAFIKSIHPQWSSSMIKSAVMTTASFSNNMGQPLTNTSHYAANPHEIGAGEINPIRALDPGLTFETSTRDHLNFLCNYGYEKKAIRALLSDRRFKCPKRSTERRISNINYPTISIGRLKQHEAAKKVKRVATNMGSPNATYLSVVNAPPGLLVKVLPKRLVFKEGSRKTSFTVIFDGKHAHKGYNFGDIRWSDGIHLVRMVFAVNVD